MLVAGSFLYRTPVRASAAVTRRRFRWQDAAVSRKGLWVVLLVALHGVGDTMLYIWMARFLGSASFATRPIPPGLVLSAYGVAYLFARGVLAVIPERRGRRSLMVAPGLLGGGMVIAGILSRDYLCTAAGYVLGAGLWSVEYPVMLSVLAGEDESRFGSLMALAHLVSYALTALGVSGMGFLAARVGEAALWRVMLVPASIFPCIGLLAAAWLFAHRQGGTCVGT
jgi:hypothetical protein